MGNLPLHPAVVHLPLGLAFVMPLAAALLTAAVWSGHGKRLGFVLMAVLQAALVAGALLALQTGEGVEEQAEHVVPESLIESHEGAAQVFTAFAVATLVAMAGLVALAERPAAAKPLSAIVLILALGTAGLAVRAGHRGGEMVYAHNAAAPFARTAATAGGKTPSTNLFGGESEDDEDD